MEFLKKAYSKNVDEYNAGYDASKKLTLLL
jgi:hypothetical protein